MGKTMSKQISKNPASELEEDKFDENDSVAAAVSPVPVALPTSGPAAAQAEFVVKYNDSDAAEDLDE
eukprot:3713880-Karenia_brevis.AAC.1